MSSNEEITTTPSPSSSADYKVLGNKSFAEQDYKTAVEHYTKGIQLEPKNHIFFSNRSASYGGLQEWDKAIEDAKECIRLNPEFIKGYYRLATAQIEVQALDGAEATIKQGLAIDANNSQLLKILRTIKQARKVSSTTTSSLVSSSPNSTIPQNGINHHHNTMNKQLDTSTIQELQDIQQQYNKTAREYNTFQANHTKAQREEKMYTVTLDEIQSNPSTGYYKSIGKIFMKCPEKDIKDHLNTNITKQQKQQKDLTGKIEYLEKRLKSQQLNMKELTSG